MKETRSGRQPLTGLSASALGHKPSPPQICFLLVYIERNIRLLLPACQNFNAECIKRTSLRFYTLGFRRVLAAAFGGACVGST
jgi:hypothetical protein